jgi:Ca2+-binding EF-hand superfamily protein
MKNFLLRSLPVAALVLLTTCLLVAAKPSAPPAKANDDVQEFVFLSEARPVLMRLHVRVDGKPLPAVWDDFLKYLFVYLDRNGDGVLSKDEAEGIPAPEQLTGGIFGLFRGNAAAASLTDLDLDKDGKVTLAELSAYYRKNSFTPLQFQLNLTPVDAGAAMAYLGGPGPDPEIDAVSKAIFERLDANKDGKLTKEELAAASTVLLALDENEDEIVTVRELVPEEKPTNNRMSAMRMMAPSRGSDSAGKSMLLPLAAPGETPADLVERMRKRYGANTKDKDKNKKLSRKELGLDEATFARLDANKDGVLDAAELAGFVKRAPDLCVAVRLGKKAAAQSVLELAAVAGRPALLADKVQQHDEVALLDLGKTRVELRRNEEKSGGNYLSLFLRPQLSAEFKRADKDKNGYLDAKEAKGNRFLNGLFKTIDRDGDGKLTEKEMLAYFDKVQEIQKRAATGCATLVLRDQSRGLFDLLDANRDGKLSVREMRQAVKLLTSLDRQGKGYISRDDIPKSYQMTLRRGPAESDGFEQQQARVVNRLFNRSSEEPQSTRGPAWFRKMDRNRDGDVSRKEFLFSDEQFRKIDSDGDGLISVEEAEKAGR